MIIKHDLEHFTTMGFAKVESPAQDGRCCANCQYLRFSAAPWDDFDKCAHPKVLKAAASSKGENKFDKSVADIHRSICSFYIEKSR